MSQVLTTTPQAETPSPVETPQPPHPSPAAARGRRRWPWWLLRGVLIALIIPGTVLAGAELATPSVAGAPDLVAAIDHAHRTQPIEVSPAWPVAQAMVAAEDGSFYSNHGVDLPGMVRALWGRLIGVDLGGSTITEQLAKSIYEHGQTGLLNRVAEVALALKLRGHYTAEAVLSMYMSAIYYGNGYYGLLAASEGYFGLSPGRLSWAQASLLAGLPNAPSALDPLQHLAAAKQRQAYVLGRLVAAGTLTEAQADAAAAAPLHLR
jgi:membrane carboxypeptidase/penicillin-binding protein